MKNCRCFSRSWNMNDYDPRTIQCYRIISVSALFLPFLSPLRMIRRNCLWTMRTKNQWEILAQNFLVAIVISSFWIPFASHQFISDLKLNWNFRIDLEDRFAYRFEVDVYFSQDVNYEARQPYRWFYEPTYNFSGIRGGRERRAKPQVAVRELINGGGKSTMFSLASCARIAVFFSLVIGEGRTIIVC